VLKWIGCGKYDVDICVAWVESFVIHSLIFSSLYYNIVLLEVVYAVYLHLHTGSL
jgi:hypothetical protein